MIPPIENTEFIGHQKVEQQLVQLVKNHKLPHAMLFAGPRGVGKATLAFRLAKYLLSGTEPADAGVNLFGEPAEENLASDAENPAIQRIIAGTHGDLLRVQPEEDEKRKSSADTIYIEQVRSVVEFMHHTPSEGSWRIVIVDPAEAMNPNAANALLKVLEEPPSQTLLMLISHQPGRLLPTIRSRCRVFSMPALKAEESEQIFSLQQSGVEPQSFSQLMRLAQQSPGMAMYFHEQDALTLYKQLLACMLSGDAQAIQNFASQSAKAPPKKWPVVKAMFTQMLYRLCLSQKLAAQFEPLDAEEAQSLQQLGSKHPVAHWFALWEKSESLLHETTTLMLDKKQVLLSLLAER